MQILVTGATETLGRFVARQLLAAGHTVSGIAERPHANLDPHVDLACARLDDPILQELANDADAVIHLAPLEDTAPGGAGIDGVARVADAAARSGSRLLFVSQAAGQPDLYRPAESLVSSGWAPSVVIRIAPPVGRQLDWMVCRTVASILRAKVSAEPMRVLHLDDLVRFLVLALSIDRTGIVDLATPDTTNVVTAWRQLRSVDPRLRLHRVPGWAELIPQMDITAAQEEWGFEYGWQAVEGIADTGRGLVGRRLDVAGATVASERLALPVEPPPRFDPPDELLTPATPEGLEGEFDDRIDPRFPIFSATGLADALPGPLTPITLDVQLSGLRMAARAVGQLLALGDVVADEWANRAIAVFGHRPYVGVSANVVAATQLPGWDEQAVTRQALGNPPQTTDLLPFGKPRLSGGALGSIAKTVVALRSVALLRHLRSDTKAYHYAATAEHLGPEQLAALPDAALEVRIRLLRDRIHQGWVLNGLWLIETGVTGERVPGVGVLTQSGRVDAETAALATAFHGDEPLSALAREGNSVSIRALSPPASAALDAAVARIGHRGPGEAELANPMFGDDATPLLRAAVATRSAAEPSPPPSPRSLPRRLAARTRASRELAHDATLRFTHEFRLTLRELGARRVAADVIDTAEDVYYLICDELVTVPSDARLRIKRRRAERERLQAQHPPDVIDHAWSAAD